MAMEDDEDGPTMDPGSPQQRRSTEGDDGTEHDDRRGDTSINEPEDLRPTRPDRAAERRRHRKGERQHQIAGCPGGRPKADRDHGDHVIPADTGA